VSPAAAGLTVPSLLLVVLGVGTGLALVGRRRLVRQLERARVRVARSWAALDAALRARAEAALAQVAGPGVDPATALLVADAAGAVLDRTGRDVLREQAESDLTAVLDLVALPASTARDEPVVLARRLHNDAVTRLRTASARRAVRLLGVRTTPVPTAFEMVEPALVWRA
jgi:hypothetical protein